MFYDNPKQKDVNKTIKSQNLKLSNYIKHYIIRNRRTISINGLKFLIGKINTLSYQSTGPQEIDRRR